MKLIDVYSYAERHRSGRMSGELGESGISNALTQNINHSLTMVVYETD